MLCSSGGVFSAFSLFFLLDGDRETGLLAALISWNALAATASSSHELWRADRAEMEVVTGKTWTPDVLMLEGGLVLMVFEFRAKRPMRVSLEGEWQEGNGLYHTTETSLSPAVR